MKKTLLVSLILTLILSIAALADNEYATAGDLYQAWYAENYENPYPDYISGVWSADGSMDRLVFGVTKDERGEAGKEEILRLVADDSTVSFTYQSHSYAELLAIQREIEPLMGDEYGVYACGIYDMENVLKISIDETNPKAEEFMTDLFARHGDRVAFEKMDGKIVLMEDTAAAASRDGGGSTVSAALGLLAILLAVFLPMLIRRSRREDTK